MSETLPLLPTPPVPEATHRELRLAGQAVQVARSMLASAILSTRGEASSAGLDELLRLQNAATHLHGGITDLLPK